MPSTPEDWNFGPSKPYLHGSKLTVGDTLVFRLISIEKEDVDTDYGPKIQMVFDVLTSTTPEIPPKVYIWNTECAAAKKLRALYIKDNIDLEDVRTLKLVMEDDGMRIKTFLGAVPS